MYCNQNQAVIRDEGGNVTKIITLEDHDHDDLYYAQSLLYTASETDDLLDGKSFTDHVHDSVYYTQAQVDALLDGKADSGHTHPSSGFPFGDSAIGAGTDWDSLITSDDAGVYEVESLAGNNAPPSGSGDGIAIIYIHPNVGDTGVRISQVYYDNDGSYFWRGYNGTTWTSWQSPIGAHNHNDTYYTKTEVDALLAGKQNTLTEIDGGGA